MTDLLDQRAAAKGHTGNKVHGPSRNPLNTAMAMAQRAETALRP